ncbi:MAG: hypothetical protein OXI79_18900 [Gammaproteobacteria bacterium]|nr:hypothetical protein [Gammaproteobacteria bacterium]
MKIKKHVLACGLVAGLAGVTGFGASEQTPFDARVNVGWWLAKEAAEDFDLDEDTEDLVTNVSVSVGAAGGALWGACVGGKIGSLGGPIGTLVGAGIGAA